MKKVIILQFFIILFFEINTYGQVNAPLPNWDFYIGDSIIASSNVEVQNLSKPTIYYNPCDSIESIKCILRTFHKEKKGNYNINSWLRIYSNETLVVIDVFYGYYNRKTFSEVQFVLNSDRFKAKLKNYIGEKLKITFQDEAFQRTPIVLGYLVVQEK